MHYCPESCRDFLDESPVAGGDGSAAPGFHYRSAPVYLLTLVVGLLFAADIVTGQLLEAGVSTWGAWQSVAGMRLALIAAVLGGSRILFQTLEGLFDGRVGADLALTIACLAAIVLGEHTTAALVVFIALCGESLEGYTIDRAQRAIRNVFNLCPSYAHVIEDGTERDVPLSDVETGMVVAVRPGERIPVDGIITSGHSCIDQSALTGESLPVDRVAGDEVHAGTLNQFGALEIETRHVGERTAIGQVLQLVAEAAEQKAPLERAADRYAKLFLPIVLGAALCTLIGWRFAAGTWQAGFLPALSVLVVACPCPLILATPAAVMSAMAWLAREGVVVKGSAALERLATVDTVAFDKTGTLTQGRFQISSLLPIAAPDPEELLRVAAIAERRSEHLIARILCRTAQEQGHVLPGVHNFEAFPGSGVVAEITPDDAGPWACELAVQYALTDSSGRMKLVVGNQRLFEQFPFEFEQTLIDRLSELDTRGETTLLVGVVNPAIPMRSPASSTDQVPTTTTDKHATAMHHSGIVLGVVGVSDQLRESARGVLSELRRAGITGLAMLTGDRESAAKKVAADLELFQTCQAQLLPADKAEWIRQTIGSGHQVAMVGDGVNDAPALATASVGIALGKAGSDIAAEAGDLILMGDPLRPLPGLLRLSRRLVLTIRQSIYLFAFGLNGLGMILGATSILSPGAAAIFHEIASLAVMVNSLRLLWFERGDSNWLSRWTRRVLMAADRVVLLLSPTQLVFRTLRAWKLLLRMSLAGIALLWFLSGLILLEPDEAAVVKRFGAFEELLEPGPHWRWPVPFEEVRRERVDQVRVVQVGFRTDDNIATTGGAATGNTATGEAGDVGTAFRQGPVEWTSEHSRSGTADLHADESLTLTGNELPVEITLEVQFHIGDLRQYCHNAADPDNVLRVLTESAARQVLARCSLDDVLTLARLRIERELHAVIEDSTAEYQLGVVIDAVALLDVHPPRQVVPAYRQVADAEELRQQLINEADAYYSRTTLAAAGSDAVELLAKPARPELDATRASDAGRAVSAAQPLSDQEWKTLIQERDDGTMLLAGEAAARLHTARRDQTARVSKATASAARFESIAPVFQQQPALTGLAVYLKAVMDSLAGRPLLIVDPSVAGRQHILLADPQQPPVGNTPGAWLQPPASNPENTSAADEDQLPDSTETTPGTGSQQLLRSDP